MPEHAADILAYAARHDYPDILDIAAPLVVDGETLSETLPKLPLNAMLRWVREKNKLLSLYHSDAHEVFLGKIL